MADTIRTRYERDAGRREAILRKKRIDAALTDPSILPPVGQNESDALPEPYQSIGPRGLTNMSGLMLTSLFPLTQPFFRLRLPPRVLADPRIPPQAIALANQRLYAMELILTATLESSGASDENGRQRQSFRAAKRNAIDQLLVIGDVLEYMDDDFRLRTFRIDQYVTHRDSSGQVLYHCIHEEIDPLSLTEEQFAATKLDYAELAAKDACDRMKGLYTAVEWQPRTKRWTIKQEVNEQLIPFVGSSETTREETISPYFSTTFKLSPGEHYGRSYTELNRGELRTVNELEKCRLEILHLASKQLIAIDHQSPTDEKDLLQDSGSIIRASVRDGKVTDVATVGFDNVQEFQMLTVGITEKTKSLAAAFLIESAVQPHQERVTATQIQRIARELDGALGGLYSTIADSQQVPLVRRLLTVARRKNLLPHMPEEFVVVETVTGLAALQREAEGMKILTFAQVLQQLGPEAISRVDIPTLVDAYMRSQSINVPGIIKTEEQIQRERQQMIQMAAAQQAIQSAGAIAETQAAGAAP